MPADVGAVDAWLDAFAACVRSGDLAAGRRLFAPEAAGFGTVAGAYDGLDDLVQHQWADVWQRTEGFVFDAPHHHWSAQDLCVVAATWRSTGVDGTRRRERTGRVTLVLRAEGPALVCVHSHFSMTPGTPA